VVDEAALERLEGAVEATPVETAQELRKGRRLVLARHGGTLPWGARRQTGRGRAARAMP